MFKLNVSNSTALLIVGGLLIALATQALSQDYVLPAPSAPLRRLPPVEPQLPPDSIDEAEPVALPAPEAPAVVETPPPDDSVPGSFERYLAEVQGVVGTWPEPWEGTIEFGLSGTEGNSNTFNMRLGAKLKHYTPLVRHDFEFTHLQKSNEDRKTADNTIIDSRIEWPLPDVPWTYYVHGSTEYDKFKGFDVRAAADAGLGYHFIKSKPILLIGRMGASVSRELGGDDDRYSPEMVAGVEWKHVFEDGQKVSAKVEYYPEVVNFSDFRINGRASWEKVIAPEWGLSLKLSAIDRYDSTPNRRIRNDLDYACLLLWAF